MHPETRPLLAVLALLAMAGCAEPKHLTFDHSRSYREAFTAQADRSRASAEDGAYELDGMEAVAIRIRVLEAATDKETEKITLSTE